MDHPAHPSFSNALRFWCKLGLISFGGPAGQISMMHEYLVAQKQWISESRFLQALNYCMLLPGPEALQLAIYSGWILHGKKGGMAAGILFVLPAMLLLTVLSVLYVLTGHHPFAAALLSGLKVAVVAIVIQALVKMGQKSLQQPVRYVVAAAAFVAVYFFNVPFPYLILAVLFIGYMYIRWKGVDTPEPGVPATPKNEYFMQGEMQRREISHPLNNLFSVLAVALLLASLPVAALLLFTGQPEFWRQLVFFFSQTALVTFGGAYAVLPYVAHTSVEQFHWLSAAQMTDGLALGETTPGPLLIVLSFVGFMAGYHQYAGDPLVGVLGLMVVTFYTFLPSFVFVLGGAPWMEKAQGNKVLQHLLSLVTAVVLGVLLRLSIFLAGQVFFAGGLHGGLPEPAYLCWLAVSLLALFRWKVKLPLWLAVSLLFGAGCYFAGIA